MSKSFIGWEGPIFVLFIFIIFNNGWEKEDPLQAVELGRHRLLLCRQQTDRVLVQIGRQNLKKLTLRKYDPLVNQHVLFNEVKMPSGKKRT